MAGQAWRWAYVLFRFGDGLGHAFLLLLPVTHYGLPVWGSAATAAAMNLAAVPATAWWGLVMEKSRSRRRLATMGFAVSGLCMVLAALLPDFALYLLGAALYAAFGVATAPAAGVLLLEGVPRRQWAATTATFSRTTAVAYLAGTATAVGVGLGGVMDARLVLLGVAVVSVLAAVVAWVTIVPAAQAPPAPAQVGRYDSEAMQAGQRRFERPVFLLTRLRNVPRFTLRLPTGAAGRLAFGVFVMFTATVMFFSSYPGVLVTTLGLSTGLALLAQTPSHLATPLSYSSVRRGLERYGDHRVLSAVAGVRALVFLAFMATVLWLGRAGYPLLLVLHALAGVTFAFIQVSAPCLLAESHPRGRGQGVGLFHASMGAGTLVGSSGALLLLLVAPLWAVYAVSATLLLWGLVLVREATRTTTTEKTGEPSA